MAERVEIEDITIAAGTLRTAPATTALTWREGWPVLVEFRFPPGPSGFVGVQLLHSNRVVIPKRGTNFLVADSEIIRWPLDGFAYNANYAVRAYNEGAFPHTIQVRMLLNELTSQRVQRVAQLDTVMPLDSYGALLEGSVR